LTDRPRNLVLIGLRATGKTTLGRALAERLAWRFLDTDEQIAATAGRPIADLFRDEGEAAFRQRERTAIAGLATATETIVSTGGGAILDDDNCRVLRTLAPCVWLDAAPETLRSRMAAAPGARPALHGGDPLDEIERVRADRAARYARLAALRLDTTTADVTELVERVVAHFGLERT